MSTVHKLAGGATVPLKPAHAKTADVHPALVHTPAQTAGPAGSHPSAVGSASLLSAPLALDAPLLKGPQAAAPTTLPRVAESFPIHALDQLDARGLRGETFFLDGGSLRGMKLCARRVRDGGERGFEITFQLAPGKVAPMVRAFEKRNAIPKPATFRGAKPGPDRVATLTGTTGEISASSSSNAPPDLDRSPERWALELRAPGGGSIELVHDKAATAVRGFVRIRLRGDDAACTRQLQGLIKTTGIGHLFAPPTPAAKQKQLLMRALWQADHAAAERLTAQDLDQVRVEDVEKALSAAGFDASRIANLRYEEVVPGHFTVLDPAQPAEMVKAGARYLYSTVKDPEHVLSILGEGQKSSLQRYREGLIITGMSTNEDFTTGGATGVFTRLVTNQALHGDGDRNWTGRTYKLIISPDVLARTDWYGWESDYYGRRHGLDSGKNFGPKLVEAIDQNRYRSNNELIFTAGNARESIQRVVATTAADRDRLIDHLRAAGYQPPGGLSLEQFVVLSPKLLTFGPSPYDASDPAAFAKDALARARAGDRLPLAWFLAEGPESGGARAEVEQAVLRSDDPSLRKLALQAARANGRFSMSAEALEKLVDELAASAAKAPEAGGQQAQATLRELVTSCAEAVLRSNSDRAVGLLGDSPHLDDEAWVRALNDLAAQHRGGKPSAAFALALRVPMRDLLRKGHRGLSTFLEQHPLVRPKDPESWVKAKVAELGKPGTDSTQLAIYLAQAKSPEDVAGAQALLLRAGNEEARRLLEGALKKERRLAIPAAELARIAAALPASAPTRALLFDGLPDLLLQTGDPALIAALKAHAARSGKPSFGIDSPEAWSRVAAKLLDAARGEVTPLAREVLERGGELLARDAAFIARLRDLPGLYAGRDASALAREAVAELGPGQAGHLKLAWLLRGPEAPAAVRLEAVFQAFAAGSAPAKRIVDDLRTGDSGGRLPFTAAEVAGLLQRLHAGGHEDGARHLIRTAGPQVLAGATPAQVALLEPYVQGGNLLAFTGSGRTVADLLAEIDARKDAGAEAARRFVLRHAVADAVRSNDPALLGYLTANALRLSDVGRDAAWAATAALDLFGQRAETYAHPERGKSPAYRELPAGVAWLLRGGGDALDPKVVAELERQIPGREWKKPIIEALADRIPGLTTDQRAGLLKGRKRNWLGF